MARKKKEMVVKSKYENTNPNIMKNSPREQYIMKAVKWLQDGLSHSAIKEMILIDKKKGTDNPEAAAVILSEAIQRIKALYTKDRQHIVSLHTQRYDREIKKLIEIDILRYDKAEGRNVKINAYLAAIETLFRKEKLLQMHTKGFQIKINNTINTKKVEKKVTYNLSELSLTEKVDFLQLMQKAKRTSTEISSVILSEKKQKAVVEDIEFEEVQVAQLDTYKPKSTEVELHPGGTLMSIQQKLADTLKRKAEEEFKRKGAKI